MNLPPFENIFIGGRAQSWFVYFLLCAGESDEAVYIKIGHSSQPFIRARTLINSCGLMAVNFGYVAVGAYHRALTLELGLHTIFTLWRTHGEWYRFERKEKDTFLTLRRDLMDKFRRPEWPLKMQIVEVAAFMRAAKKRQTFYKSPYSRFGKPYQDFEADCDRS